MQRYGDVTRNSKFGNRRIIPEIDQSASIQLNSLNIQTINGVFVADTTKLNETQSADIETNKQDIIALTNRIYYLENIIKMLIRLPAT
jgi:hypothetical protein